TSNTIRKFIGSLKGKKTIILCTHYMDEAEALCDRVAILNQGKILDIGTPDYLKSKIHGETILNVKVENVDKIRPADIKNLESVENVRIIGDQVSVSLSSSEEICDIVELFENNILSVNTKEPTLEDVFIQKVK
ncbi:MAG: DUF4162 domain-containing protein, partial [Methanobacteriaceae archaeon]|nr:DUF4162 domain-containing protein [Methanobacteriaceae archaeon]